MTTSMNSILKLAAAGVLFSAASACAPGDTSYRTESAAGIVVESDWTIPALSSDGAIAGALIEINEAEVDMGQLARGRSGDSAIRAFAQVIIDDHSIMKTRIDSLADALDIDVVDEPEALADANERALDELKAIDNGASKVRPMAFDQAFVGQMVTGHRQVLAFVDSSIARATNPQLVTALQTDVRPSVMRHLQRAEELQASLGSAPMRDTMATMRDTTRQK
jgi:putative membrane protein